MTSLNTVKSHGRRHTRTIVLVIALIMGGMLVVTVVNVMLALYGDRTVSTRPPPTLMFWNGEVYSVSIANGYRWRQVRVTVYPRGMLIDEEPKEVSSDLKWHCGQATRDRICVIEEGGLLWNDWRTVWTYGIGANTAEGFKVVSGKRAGRRTSQLFAQDLRLVPVEVNIRSVVGETVIVSTALLAMVWMMRCVRLVVRMRRGRCPDCGYQLAVIVVRCPECGAAGIPCYQGRDAGSRRLEERSAIAGTVNMPPGSEGESVSP